MESYTIDNLKDFCREGNLEMVKKLVTDYCIDPSDNDNICMITATMKLLNFCYWTKE